MSNNQKELLLLEDLGYLFPKEDSKTKRRYGVFKCYCGKEFKALIPNVKIGHTKSCGWVNQKIQSRNTRVLRINNSSGYRGVCWHKATNKFIAKITVNLKSIYLGLFITAIEAAKVYDKYILDNNLEHTKNF